MARRRQQEKVYRSITNPMWAILRGVAKGKFANTPIWHFKMGSLSPLIDPSKRGWLQVDSEGHLVFTSSGLTAYEAHDRPELPLRDESGNAFKTASVSDTVKHLLTARANMAIERQRKIINIDEGAA